MVNHSNLQKSSSVEELLQQLHLNHADDFPNLLRIADWSLAIFLSAADCERDFSLLKLVKSARRNRLSNQILEQIMVIKINRPSCEDFPFDDARATWQEKQLQRMKIVIYSVNYHVSVSTCSHAHEFPRH